MKVLFILFVLVSCGRVDTNAYKGPTNILKNWQGTYENPSFASVKINQSVNASKYLICTGSYPSNNPVPNSAYNGNPTTTLNTYPPGFGNTYNTVYDPYAGDTSNPNYYNGYYPQTNCYQGNGYYYYGNCQPNYQNNPSLQNNRYTGYANAGRGQMIVRANNENEGTISFGELPYVGANNSNCQIFSNQTLKYEVSGSRLLVCFQAPNDNICFDYTESY